MNNKDDKAGIDFLDFLFTVAISIGLTPEILSIPGISGLLSESWNLELAIHFTDADFNRGVFLLALLNLTLSWFGYHASITTRPLNYSSVFGMFRFVLDVFLVIVYGIMLVMYKNFGVVLILLLFVYLSYVIWDLLKIGEYWDEFKRKEGPFLNRYRREWVTFVSFNLVAVITLLHYCFEFNRWAVLGSAIIITFFYRFNKIFPTWERLFGVK